MEDKWIEDSFNFHFKITIVNPIRTKCLIILTRPTVYDKFLKYFLLISHYKKEIRFQQLYIPQAHNKGKYTIRRF